MPRCRPVPNHTGFAEQRLERPPTPNPSITLADPSQSTCKLLLHYFLHLHCEAIHNNGVQISRCFEFTFAQNVITACQPTKFCETRSFVACHRNKSRRDTRI